MDSHRPPDAPLQTVSLGDDELDSPGRAAEAFGAAAAMLPMPTEVGRYVVGRRLGAGGMGEVFEAHDAALGRTVALKLVHGELVDANKAAAVRLLREAQTLARINHPNVVPIYEVGLHDGRVFLAMEAVRGATLRAWSQGAHTVAERLDVLLQAAAGLYAVHRVALVHRDVKPDNVLVGDDGRVRVVDFGLSRSGGPPTDPPHSDAHLPVSWVSPDVVLPARLTVTGAMVGTPVYMAPEQLRRQVIDARCDQFAFCVMAWEVLAGQRPFPSGSLGVLMEAHLRGPTLPQPTAALPAGVWQALARGLAVDPGARWPDLDALAEALRLAVRPRAVWRERIAIATVAASLFAVPWWLAQAQDAPCSALGLGGETARAEAARLSTLAADEHRHVAAARLLAQHKTLAELREAVCVGAEVADDPRVAACLERGATRLVALTDALERDGVTPGVLAAIDAAPQHTCGMPSAAPAGPEAPEAARAVELARAAIDAARLELQVGHVASVAVGAPALVALVEGIGHAPLVAELALLQGELAEASGEPQAAHEHLRRAANVASSVDHELVVADAWAAAARVAVTELDDAELAEHDVRQAEAAAARIGPDPERVRTIALRRAQLATLRGDVETARRLLRPLVAGLPEAGIAAIDWPILGIAAEAEEQAGALDEAVALHLRLRQSMVAALGDDATALASVDYNLGQLELRRDRSDAALAALTRAHDAWLAAYGSRHPDLALVHTALQQWEMQYGSFDAARMHAERALAVRVAALPSTHPDLGLAHLGVGAAALLQGDVDAALDAYAAALAIHEAALGVDHPQTALVRLNLAEARVDAGQGAAAKAEAEAALAVLGDLGEIDPGLLAFAHRVHAGALRSAGTPAAALEALGRAEALGVEVPDPQEAAQRGLERVRLARMQPGSVDWAGALAEARARASRLGGDGATMVAARLDALAADPPRRTL